MFAYVMFLLSIHHAEQNANLDGIVAFYYDVVKEVTWLNPQSFIDKWIVASSSSADTDIANSIAELKQNLDKLETILKKWTKPPTSDCDFALSYTYATTMLTMFERMTSSPLYSSHPPLKKAGCLWHKSYLKWDSSCPKFKGKEDLFSLLSLGKYYPGYYLSRVDGPIPYINPSYASSAEKVRGWERMWFYTADKRDEITYGQAVGIDNKNKLLDSGGDWVKWELKDIESHIIWATCNSNKLGQIRYCDPINLKNNATGYFAMVTGQEVFGESDSVKGTWVLLNHNGAIPILR